MSKEFTLNTKDKFYFIRESSCKLILDSYYIRPRRFLITLSFLPLCYIFVPAKVHIAIIVVILHFSTEFINMLLGDLLYFKQRYYWNKLIVDTKGGHLTIKETTPLFRRITKSYSLNDLRWEIKEEPLYKNITSRKVIRVFDLNDCLILTFADIGLGYNTSQFNEFKSCLEASGLLK